MPPVIIVNVSHGGAAEFLEFFEKELIPFVDRTWRTVPTPWPSRTFPRRLVRDLCAGAAASPSLQWDNGLLLTAARDRLRKLPAPVRLDLSSGDDNDAIDSTKALAKILDELKPAGLDYRLAIYPGENHNSVRLLSFPAGLYWAYRPAN